MLGGFSLVTKVLGGDLNVPSVYWIFKGFREWERGRKWVKMKIGYIVEHDLKSNPNLVEHFEFREATFTRMISSRGDRVYSKMLQFPVDYEEIVSNANIMKENPKVILVREPFLLDNDLREKVTKWVAWANNADQKEYDPFVEKDKGD